MTSEEAVEIIEKGSVFKLSAMVDDGGAFMIPVGPNDVPMARSQQFTKAKLLKFAELVKNKPVTP